MPYDLFIQNYLTVVIRCLDKIQNERVPVQVS
jgi:hypothetical protein